MSRRSINFTFEKLKCNKEQRHGVDSTFKLPVLNNTKRPETENVTKSLFFLLLLFCSQFNSFRCPFSFWGNLRESSLFSVTWEYSLIYSFELNLCGVCQLDRERGTETLKFKKQTTKKNQLFFLFIVFFRFSSI